MVLMIGVFLFNLLCGLVPCDPTFQKPEVRSVPLDKVEITRNIAKRSLEPIVKVSSGIVEGYRMKSMSGRTIFAFEGIPYGESTGGSGRWKPPVPKRPWRGVRQTKKPGPDCLQFSLAKMLRVYGSEDCLYLNVFTSDLPHAKENSRPVVVFLHGGSFLMGSGSEYGPSYLLNEDVVLVTLNYRLGVLGFLSTGDEVLPGNYGLKDQALAMKWVYDNVGHFGGNPKNISLWGNSAGGVSVNLHMISNKTREYFTTGFSSSGTAFQNWAVQGKERMTYLANRLAKTFGCRNEDSRALFRCFKRTDSNALVAAQLDLFDWFPFPPVLFSPIVEPEHPDAFLTISPTEAYNTGAVAKKPYVVGVTKNEGKTAMLLLLVFMKTIPLQYMWKQVAPHYLFYNHLVHNPDEVTRQIEKFYLHGKSPREGSLDDFADMSMDRYLMHGIVTGLQAHVSLNASSYFYYFSFSEANHNLANVIGYKSSNWGPGHAEDIFYFFNDSLTYNGQKEADPDHQLSLIMINLLVNFAVTGEPKYRSDSGELLSIWEPVQNSSQLKAIQFDKDVEMIPFPDYAIRRLKFWDSLKLPDLKLWSPL